jgi:hypothetical protein
MSPDAQQLVKTLKQFQRRAFLVLTLSGVTTGILYTLLGLLTYALLWPVSAVLAQWATMLVLIIVMSSVAVFTARHLPTLRAITVQVDRIYQLQQRLETAMACLQQQDAVARLLHRDANHHLQAIAPARLLPYRFTIPVKTLSWTAGLVLTLTLGLRLTVHSDRDRSIGWWAGQSEPSLSVASDASQHLSHRDPPPSALTPGGTAMQQPAVHHTDERRFSKVSGISVSAPAAAGSRPTHLQSINRDTAERDRLPTTTSTPANSIRLARKISHHPTRQTQAPPSSNEPAAQSVPARTSSQRSSDSRASALPATMERRAATTGGPFASLTRQPEQRIAASMSGAVDAQAGHAADGPTDLMTYRRTYQRHWQTAEAVLQREEIPAGLRDYIRAYFTAIHP